MVSPAQISALVAVHVRDELKVQLAPFIDDILCKPKATFFNKLIAQVLGVVQTKVDAGQLLALTECDGKVIALPRLLKHAVKKAQFACHEVEQLNLREEAVEVEQSRLSQFMKTLMPHVDSCIEDCMQKVARMEEHVNELESDRDTFREMLKTYLSQMEEKIVHIDKLQGELIASMDGMQIVMEHAGTLCTKAAEFTQLKDEVHLVSAETHLCLVEGRALKLDMCEQVVEVRRMLIAAGWNPIPAPPPSPVTVPERIEEDAL